MSFSPVVSGRCSFLGVSHYLWLLKSFCFLCCMASLFLRVEFDEATPLKADCFSLSAHCPAVGLLPSTGRRRFSYEAWTLTYEHIDMSWGVILLLCSISRIIVVSSPLVQWPILCWVFGYFSSVGYIFHLMQRALNPIKKLMFTPITCMPLSQQFIFRQIALVGHRVHSWVRLITFLPSSIHSTYQNYE